MNQCRTLGAVDWSTTMVLSLIPFAEFGSFYRLGISSFEGSFELAHIIFTVIFILKCIVVENDKLGDCAGFSCCIIIIFVLLDLAKILVDFNTATPNEIIIQIIFVILSFTISVCCGANVTDDRMRCVCGALILTASLGVMEWLKHIWMLVFSEELDVNGCPLI